MSKNEITSKLLDETLRLAVMGGVLGAVIVLPNILVSLDKPLQKYYDSYDKRQRAREARRIVYYMKEQGYLSGSYDHGLTITSKARKRLEQLDFDTLEIFAPVKWDHTWRMVIYDIPENHKNGRFALATKLRLLGFFQLQRSAWIHPFPCQDIVANVCLTHKISKYVSYMEVINIDNEGLLIQRFRKKLPNVKFQ